MIPLSFYLILAVTLFVISILGMYINRSNLVSVLMMIELMLLAVNINFAAFSSYLQSEIGYIFVFCVFTVAAAESAIGLAIIVLIFRAKKSIHISDVSELKN
jgi:NADH-quinone oxidoreductase subunit K